MMLVHDKQVVDPGMLVTWLWVRRALACLLSHQAARRLVEAPWDHPPLAPATQQ